LASWQLPSTAGLRGYIYVTDYKIILQQNVADDTRQINRLEIAKLSSSKTFCPQQFKLSALKMMSAVTEE
jgi:hypothetical protein